MMNVNVSVAERMVPRAIEEFIRGKGGKGQVGLFFVPATASYTVASRRGFGWAFWVDWLLELWVLS